MRIGRLVAWGVAVFLSAAPVVAGPANVLEVRGSCSEDRLCRFAVTIHHADEGWDHFADRFEVLAPDGSVLATRVLRHPHVDEQPFTRWVRGVKVPEDVTKVRFRAGDSVHGFDGTEVELPLRF